MAVDDDYLKKYLTASGPSTSAKKKKKSKKSKTDSSQPGLIIADDDLSGFHNPSKPTDDDDDFVPQIVGGARSADFRKTKKSGWVTVGAAAPSNADQAAADAVFAAAQAERDAANAALEAADAPVVVGEDGEDVAGAGSGKLTGLQSGSQVAKAMKAKADAERREFETMDATMTGKGQETVYRDGTGRIVNVAKLKAQAQRKAEEEEAKKRKAAEEAKGDVQRAEKKARKEQLEEAKFMTLARYADDEELNAELKEQDRWNDPLAGLVGSKKKGKSVTGKPLYKGAAPPNRYGIRPGYRWDGVDRSNGFEKEYFAAQNRRKNMQELQHAWEMDE